MRARFAAAQVVEHADQRGLVAVAAVRDAPPPASAGEWPAHPDSPPPPRARARRPAVVGALGREYPSFSRQLGLRCRLPLAEPAPGSRRSLSSAARCLAHPEHVVSRAALQPTVHAEELG